MNLGTSFEWIKNIPGNILTFFKAFFNGLKNIWQRFIAVINLDANKNNVVYPLFIVVMLSLGAIFLVELMVATVQWNDCQPEPQQQSQPQSQPEPRQQSQPQSQNAIFISCGQREKDFSRDSYVGYLLQKIVYFTTQTSVILMIIIFAYFAWIAYQRYSQNSQRNLKSREHSRQGQPVVLGEKTSVEPVYRFLTEVLAGSLSISAIPTGVSLMICAFYEMAFIKHLLGVEIYVAFAGISILSIGFLAAMQESEQMSENDDEVNNAEDIFPSDRSENGIGIDELMRTS